MKVENMKFYAASSFLVFCFLFGGDIREELDRGKHIYYWDGKNSSDNSGSSLYFAELLGERSKTVKKIVYLK